MLNKDKMTLERKSEPDYLKGESALDHFDKFEKETFLDYLGNSLNKGSLREVSYSEKKDAFEVKGSVDNLKVNIPKSNRSLVNRLGLFVALGGVVLGGGIVTHLIHYDIKMLRLFDPFVNNYVKTETQVVEYLSPEEFKHRLDHEMFIKSIQSSIEYLKDPNNALSKQAK